MGQRLYLGEKVIRPIRPIRLITGNRHFACVYNSKQCFQEIEGNPSATGIVVYNNNNTGVYAQRYPDTQNRRP